jgi:hypothetical protein
MLDVSVTVSFLSLDTAGPLPCPLRFHIAYYILNQGSVPGPWSFFAVGGDSWNGEVSSPRDLGINIRHTSNLLYFQPCFLFTPSRNHGDAAVAVILVARGIWNYPDFQSNVRNERRMVDVDAGWRRGEGKGRQGKGMKRGERKNHFA